jgi:TP901 family phage tail tape measure protein
MADIRSTFRYDSDFSKVTKDIKNLVREATAANSAFAQLNKTAASIKMDAASTFASQAGFAGFKAQIVDLTGATEGFGQQLMKNKLTMREYFREAAVAYRKDSKARILAEREVRRAQSAVVGMGDVGGRRKGILLTPDALDMRNAANNIAVLNKQYEVFNHLVNRGATELVNWGKNTQWAGRQLTVGLTVPMAIFSTQALKAFSEVDRQITRFRKVYGSDLTGTVGNATDEMIGQIRTLGSEFAKQYGIASSETMALAADLAATGLEGQKLASAVTQTTRMMVLGEVDRQEAMKATLSIQTAFNQSSRELAQSIDFLNAVENQTSASLQDLVEAIPKTGPVIQALGGDIKDLSILMTAMREGGIAAGEGANAIKSGMASLISPTKQAIEVARQFGIDLQGVVDRNRGQLMPMLLDFQDQLRGLDDFGKAKIIEQIFGKYQFARISALFDNLNQQGSQTIGMVKLMNASADELAKKAYSELKAQERAPSTRLAAAQQQLQEQLIRVGADLAETLLPIMQKALDILQKVVDGFNNLPTPIKNFAKILAGVAAVSGPILMLAGIFGNLIGNAMKFGMSIINLFKRITGSPVQQLQILTDEELAAKIAADQLTGAYNRQKTSVDLLNKSLSTYIANLRNAATVAPPGAVMPSSRGPRPIRRKDGGVIYAENGVDTGGKINGYGGGDKVPALLEKGEFVINKESSRRFAPILRSINDGTYGQYSNGLTERLTGTEEERRVFQEEYAKKGLKAKVSSAPKSYEQVFADLSRRGLLNQDEITALSHVYPDSAKTQSVSDRYKLGLSDGEVRHGVGVHRAHFMAGKNALDFSAQLPSSPTPTQAGYQRQLTASGFTADAHLPGMAFLNDYALITSAEGGGLNQLVESLGASSDDTFRTIADELNRSTGKSYDANSIRRIIRDTRPLVVNKELQSLFQDISESLLSRTDDNLLNALTNNRKNIGQLSGALVTFEQTKDIIDGRVSGTNPKSLLNGQLISAAHQAEISAAAEDIRKGATQIGSVLERGPLGQKQKSLIAKIVEPLTGRKLIYGKGLQALEDIFYSENELRQKYGSSVAVQKLQERQAKFAAAQGRNPNLSYDDWLTEERKRNLGRVGLRDLGQLDEIRYVGQSTLQKGVDTVVRAEYAAARGSQKQYLFSLSEKVLPIIRSIIRAKIPGMKNGGLVGGLMQILSRSEQKALPEATELLQKGFNINDWMKKIKLDADSVPIGKLSTQTVPKSDIELYIDALRKKQTGTMHDTQLFRGTSIDSAELQALKPGDIFEVPGTSSFSASQGTATTFASMHRIGAERRYTYGQKGLMEELGMGDVGAANWGTRVATTPAEEQLIMRSNRVFHARQYLSSRRQLADLQRQRQELEDALFPSQEGTLFGKQLEPFPYEVKKRKEALDEFDRKIRNARGSMDYSIERNQAERAKSRFLQNREPLIISIKTPRGTMTLPLTDIAGDKRFIEGMGVMSEAEHLLTNSRIRVTGKSTDPNGFSVLEGELIGAQKFNMGGPVLKYANGGKLPGFGGGDKVPALLEPGEFVINKDATKNNLGLLAQINGGMGNTQGYGKFAVGGLAKLFAGLTGSKAMMIGFGAISAATLPSIIEGIMTTGLDPMSALMLGLNLVGLKQGVGAGGLNLMGGLKAGRGISAAQKAQKAMMAKGMGQDAIQRQMQKQAMLKGGGGAGGALAQKMLGGGILKGIARVGLKAIPVVGTLATIYEIGNFIRDMKVEQWVNQIRDVYGEATEMAKVYNIELKKTGAALKENEKQTRSMGMAAAIVGRGQIEKDYAAAVTQDYGDAIERIKGLGTEQEKANTLTEVYTSLLTQGFDTTQAKEITAEIARQSMATEAFNSAWNTTLKGIKNAEDAMGVLVTSVQATIKNLGTAEEKATAFVGAYENLLRQSADNPIEFGVQTAQLINSQNLDPQSLRMGIEQSLGNMGYGPESAAADAFANLNLATESGRESAQLFMRALAAGIDPKDLNLPPIELEAKVNFNEASRQAKIDLDNQLRDYIKTQEDAMEKVNDIANGRIAALEKEKGALADAHESRMKQLDAEAEALQDRADLINDNTDEYIKLLEKEYKAEEFYNNQRQTSIDGLSSLAKGDLFGFVQSQIQQASDAQQFGREEAINQIEDTRDNAIKGIDAQLKANQKAANAAGEAADAQMDNIDKKIEKINIGRNKSLRGLQGLIDKSQEIIDMEVGEVTATDLQKLEDAAIEVAEIVPPKVKESVNASSKGLVEGFDTAIKNAATALADAYGLDQAAAQKLYAAVIGGFTATSGAGSNAQGILPPGFGTTTITVSGIGSVKQYQAQNGQVTGQQTSKFKKQFNPTSSTYSIYNSNGKMVASGITGDSWNGIPLSSMQFLNKGGMVMRFNKGSIVPGVGNTDTVPAMLTPGEFVVNKKATAANLSTLQAMNSGGRVGYNMGGMVGGRIGMQMGGKVPEYSMPESNSARVTSVMTSTTKVKNNNLNMPVNISVTSNDPQQAANLVVKEFRRVQRSMENRFRS